MFFLPSPTRADSNAGQLHESVARSYGMTRPCAGAVGSIGESAPGKIATEFDAQFVLTGIAKAQPQDGTAPPNSPWRALRQAPG